MGNKTSFALAVVLRVFLNISRWVILISGGLVLIGMTIALFMAPQDFPLPIPIKFRMDSTLHQVHSIASSAITGKIEAASGVLHVNYKGRGWITAGILLIIVVMGEAWIVTHNLWRMMQSVTRDAPFLRENSRRLRAIGLAVIAAELLLTTAGYFSRQWVAASYAIDGLTLQQHFDLNLDTILIGLLLLVLAEIFRHGTALEEDQSLTV